MSEFLYDSLWKIVVDYAPIIENALVTMITYEQLFQAKKQILTYEKTNNTYTILLPPIGVSSSIRFYYTCDQLVQLILNSKAIFYVTLKLKLDTIITTIMSQ